MPLRRSGLSVMLTLTVLTAHPVSGSPVACTPVKTLERKDRAAGFPFVDSAEWPPTVFLS